MNKKFVTMKDIAKEVGVSINTVSKAFKDHPDISEKTKSIILDTAEKMGYIKNYSASILRGKKSGLLGTIYSDGSNPFFSEVGKGIEYEADKNGYNVITMNSMGNLIKEKKNIMTLLENRVDGLILFPINNKMEYYDIYNLKQNTVLAGQPFDGDIFDNVYTDEFNGAFKAVDYLIKSGRKKIMMIDNFLFKIGKNKRYQGYTYALEKNNIKYSNKLHKVVGKLDRIHRINEGKKIIEKAVKDNIKFDAVFTFNDLLAFGVIKGLHESGLKIPEDVSVMGYDDLDLSRMITPSLSTVKYDKFDMGGKIVKTLMKRLKKPDKKTERVKIDTDIVIRASTKGGE